MTNQGWFRIEKLEFPEDFPTGKYTLRVEDKNDPRLGPVLGSVECEVNIAPNPNSAEAAAQKKGPAKKK